MLAVTVFGVVLLAVGIGLFGVGFVWPADSRIRARVNVATIVACYFGLVLALAPQLVGSSAP